MKVTDYGTMPKTILDQPTDNALFDATLPGLRCTICNATHTLRLPMLTREVVAITRAFIQRHAGCAA